MVRLSNTVGAFATASFVSLALSTAACNRGRCCAHPVAGPPFVPPVAAPAGGLDAQVARGRASFAQHCASCHGQDGRGSALGFPPLVGPDALPFEPPAHRRQHRLMEFRTAADVHRFASVAMPMKNPGSLPPDDYWAITAWLMNQNGKPMSGPLGPGNAASVRLH